jgi:hypothetical protein
MTLSQGALDVETHVVGTVHLSPNVEDGELPTVLEVVGETLARRQLGLGAKVDPFSHGAPPVGSAPLVTRL